MRKPNFEENETACTIKKIIERMLRREKELEQKSNDKLRKGKTNNNFGCTMVMIRKR